MKQDVRSILDDRRRPRLLVVGDLMLDRYVWGEVDRISPEAPIPVLRISREEDRPGGAASVACNLSRLGCESLLAGVVGNDPEGEVLRRLLAEADVAADAVGVDRLRPTVLKCRQLARGQQVLRVDREVARPLAPEPRAELDRAIRERIPGLAALVLSDYGKGVLTDEVLRGLIDAAHAAGVPVLVDPKRSDFTVYRGADLITPNRGEASLASGVTIECPEDALRAADALCGRYEFGAVAITLDREGLVLAGGGLGEPVHVPTRPREVIDVTGAGDMVISVFALALAGNHDLLAAAALANVAGGLVVSRVGVVSVSRFELRAAVSHEAGQHLRKLMDLGDLAALCAAIREQGRQVVLTVGDFDGIGVADIDRLRQAREAAGVVVVGLRASGEPGGADTVLPRARVLAALEDVDYIVAMPAGESAAVLEAVRPDVLLVDSPDPTGIAELAATVAGCRLQRIAPEG